MATAENIITNVRSLLREESGSDVPVIGDTFLYEAITDGQNKWRDTFQAGGEDQITSQLETGFDLVADTALAEAVTTATTDFDVDSGTNLASSGVLLIWDDNMPDFVTYTGKSTNNLTGVTGIGFAHEDGDAVQKLYALPSNFSSFRESATYGDGVLVEGTPYNYMNGVPIPGYFSLYDDGTTKYLVLPRGLTGSASVLFNSAYNTIDDANDVVGVPERFKFFLIWHVVAMCYVGRDEAYDRLLAAQNESDKVLRRAMMNRNTGKRIRTRPLGTVTKDWTSINGSVFPLYRG